MLADGTVYVVRAHFLDIVADRRIIYAYDMHRGEARLSASLVTVELEPGGRGTRMRFTEQVALLDGYRDRAGRIQGTKDGLDRLELELQGAPDACS